MKKMQYRILSENWRFGKENFTGDKHRRLTAIKDFAKTYKPGDGMNKADEWGWSYDPVEEAVFESYDEAVKVLKNYKCSFNRVSYDEIVFEEYWIEGMEVDEDGDYTGGELFEEFADVDDYTAEKIADFNNDEE